MKYYISFYLIALFIIAPGYLFAQSKGNEVLPNDFSSKAFAHIEYLAGLGHRQVGTQNDAITVDFLKQQFRLLNIDVQAQPFTFQSYEFTSAVLEINGKKINVTGLGINPYLNQNFEKSEGVPLLIDLSNSDKNNSLNEVEGKTIIAKDWNSHFQLMMLKPGLIIYINPQEFKIMQNLPNLYYKLIVEAGSRKYESANVVAKVGKDSTREILITAHFDTYKKDNPGAGDNGSGIAVLLELARYFKQKEKRGKGYKEIDPLFGRLKR